MNTQKEKFREVSISWSGKEGEELSSLKKSELSTSKTKSIHPPIENHWHFPPQKEYKSSSFSFKSMISYPFKFRDSLKKIRRTKSMQTVLEGVHDPKDERVVENFRKLLFVDGQLLGKPNDYHTLLR